MIYFAQPTNGGPIRIGCTENVDKRANQLGSWIIGGVEIVAQIPGTYFTEAVLHRVFEPLRFEKDWFRSCPAMWRFLIPLTEGVTPFWLPLDNTMSRETLEYEVLSEFGSIEAGAVALGYVKAANLKAAARTSSVNGYGLAARLWVYRAFKHGVIPAELAALHAAPMARAA